MSFSSGTLTIAQVPAYTSNMSEKQHNLVSSPCLCGALRQASRAVSRLYDEELRGVGLRTTQYSLLCVLARAGPVRQGELSGLTSLDETTLTRNLRPLLDARWIAVRSGDDRREKVVTITKAGTAKLAEARPAWERAPDADAGRCYPRMHGGASWRSSRISQGSRPRLDFFAHIDAYTGFWPRPKAGGYHTPRYRGR